MAIDDFAHKHKGKLHFYCPLCQYHQSTNTIERLTWKHHGQMALAILALTVLAYPIFGTKALAFYFPLWGAFEFFYRLRKRQALICESCGFDPFLYKQDIRKARVALKKHWQTRIETENLFAGRKLRNYQTKSLSQAPAATPPSSEKPQEDSPASPTA